MGEGCFIIAICEGDGAVTVKCACGNPKHVRTARRVPKRTIASIMVVLVFAVLTTVINAVTHIGIIKTLEVGGFWYAVVLAVIGVFWFVNWIYAEEYNYL